MFMLQKLSDPFPKNRVYYSQDEYHKENVQLSNKQILFNTLLFREIPAENLLNQVPLKVAKILNHQGRGKIYQNRHVKNEKVGVTAEADYLYIFRYLP